MNETTTTKKTEFVFRRLADSFDQFVGDLAGTVFESTFALVLLGLFLIAAVARVTYHYADSQHREPGTKDPLAANLKIGMWAALFTFIAWSLYAYYRRDTDPNRTAGEGASGVGSGNAVKWYSFTIGLFLLGGLFVALMYLRDMKTIRWFWALPLALLRISVYAMLCVVFLLPAEQTWEDTNKQSRVVILIDISPSMTDKPDEIGKGGRTRMQILIEFLSDNQIAFMKNLLEKNPVAIYAFGTRLDESPEVIAANDPAWTKADWTAFAKYDFRPFLLRGLSAEGKEQVKKSPDWSLPNAGDAGWAQTLYARRDDPELQKNFGLTAVEDTDKFKKNLVLLDRRIDVANTIRAGTNVADSVTAVVNRESANMVQGVIVFSDGRSNLGSESGYAELRDRAAREKIPIFTVAVGEDRETVAISISGVQAPSEAPIDEAWRVIVEADGINLANKEVEVELQLFMPDTQADGTTRPKDMKSANPDHTMTGKLTFAPGDPPHGQTEFVIDPADPKLEKLTVESKDAAIKKRVFVPGKWGTKARIKKDDKEAFPDEFHVRERPGINVVQQKLRVLLVASAPSREFTFLRTLLVREVQDRRATLTTFVQNEAGTTGKLTPEADEKILLRFPNRFDLSNKPPADAADIGYNFNDYDVMLVFDPDWTELSAQQADDLGRWVREGGGGLIYVAGTINTFQLARVEDNKGPLVPLLEILPVLPDDSVRKIRATPRIPRRLYLHPERILGSDLLKLDDKVADDPIAGWERFFTDRDKYVRLTDFDPDGVPKELLPRRGFFSAYPIKSVKPGAAVLAELADMADNREPTIVPWIVTNNPSASYRTAFLASGELHKMQAFEPGNNTGREYFQRFYVKLIKYMAAKRNVKAPRGRVLLSKEGVSGAPLRVQARILNDNAKAYNVGQIDPKFKVIQESPNGEKRELGPFDLAAKTTPNGGFDGYYAGQVLLDQKQFPPGDSVYRVVIEVPDSAGETLTDTFSVRKSDPEMDNTRPDLLAMLRMASAYDADFQGRVPDKIKLDLNARLPKEAGVPRLAFRIADTEALKLIPECMKAEKRLNQNKGPVRDLWDATVNFDLTPAQVSPAMVRTVISALVFMVLLVGWNAVSASVPEWAKVVITIVWAVLCVLSLMSGALLIAFTGWNPLHEVLSIVGIVITFLAFRAERNVGLMMFGGLAATAAVTWLVVNYSYYSGGVYPVSGVLLLVVGVLCAEWVARKLLRLA